MQLRVFVTGCNWAPIYFSTSCILWHHSLCNDWVWMDCCQILLVSIFHVLHIAVLYLLRHDDCGCDAKPPYCRHNSDRIYYNMESIFRIHNPATSKYFPLLMCRFSCVRIYLTITNSFSFFLFLSLIYLEINRGFLYGGDGTTGHVQ